MIERIPDGASDRYLLPGPRVPLTVTAGDGTAAFDGESIRLEWTGWAEASKKSAGPQHVPLADLAGVEWVPQVGWENGYLRFRIKNAGGSPPPKHDPYCVTWGIQKLGGTTVLLAAAVVARLPHPSATSEPDPAITTAAAQSADVDTLTAGSKAGDDPDALLRRLRELGDLRRDGVLTEDEFTVAKQALLAHLQPANHPPDTK